MAKQVKAQEKPETGTEPNAPLPILSEVAEARVLADKGDGRLNYTVTEKAPPRVAGRRVMSGETIRLTEAEARGELLALHIELATAGLSDEQLAAVRAVL